MKREFNIYCDESCHLLHDGNDIMILGGILCDKKYSHIANKEIKQLKLDHCLSPTFEIKWNKVGAKQEEFCKDCVDYFFNTPFLEFRALILKGKTKIQNQSDDFWYYRMYYLLLRLMVNLSSKYDIYLDTKGAKNNHKTAMLQDVLNRSLYVFKDETINKIQVIRSEESSIMQLTDLFIGALSYHHRGLDTSSAKINLVNRIKEYSGLNLDSSASDNKRFSIFVWEPFEDGK